MFDHFQFEYLESLLSKENSPNLNLKSFFFETEKPKTIYRYRKFDSFWRNNLFNGEIYLASLDTLNDPYEGRWVIDIDNFIYINFYKKTIEKFDKIILEKQYISNEDVLSILFCIMAYAEDDKLEKEYGINKQKIIKFLRIEESLFDQIILNFKNDIKKQVIKRQNLIEKQMRKNVCVSCFTEDNINNLMWSHYADSHNGFCIEYDLTKIKQEDRNLIVPVIYTEKRFISSIKKYPQLEYYHWIPLLIKGSEWAYEKEWRIFSPIKPENQLLNNYKDAISGIYLGYNSLKNYQNEVNEISGWASNKNIPIYIEDFSKTDFGIIFSKYC